MGQKLTIEDCRETAKKMGGECLSSEYKNQSSHLQWRCAVGHEWSANYHNIRNKGFWCPHCAGNARVGIEWFKEHARSKGGECLSTEYKNQESLLRFRCSCSYEWETSGASVKNMNAWCPHCAGVIKPTIEEAHAIAANHTGLCLSEKYINAREKLEWQCAVGHKWQATLNVTKKGHWCNLCADRDRALASNYAIARIHWKTGEEIVCVASYERDVVDWLNKNKINYEWQKYIFVTPFKTPTGKESTYRPDLYLTDQNIYVEIKGRMYPDAQEKWDWFHAKHPNSELWMIQDLKAKGIR